MFAQTLTARYWGECQMPSKAFGLKVFLHFLHGRVPISQPLCIFSPASQYPHSSHPCPNWFPPGCMAGFQFKPSPRLSCPPTDCILETRPTEQLLTCTSPGIQERASLAQETGGQDGRAICTNHRGSQEQKPVFLRSHLWTRLSLGGLVSLG